MDASCFSTPLAVLGPILAMVGAALLAYDAAHGPMRNHIHRRFELQAKAWNDIYRKLKTTFPSPPYTPEEVAREQAELERQCDEQFAAIQAEATQSDLEHRELTAKLAFWGFTLVAIGSLAQALAAWLATVK